MRRSPFPLIVSVSPSVADERAPPSADDRDTSVSRLELVRKIKDSRDFWSLWSTYSWPATVPTLTQLMDRHGKIGQIVVFNGGANPLSVPLTDVLEFLASLHTDKKSAYATVNVHRSMLSKTLPHVDGRLVGQHPLVKSLLSGCYN